MTEKDLRELLASHSENENIEFKIASESFSVIGKDKKSLYGYCVGIGNSGGGKIIFGVSDDRKIVGTKCFPNLEEVKSQIYNKIESKIQIDEIITAEGNRVLVVSILSRPKGRTFNFYGVPLTRVGEELIEMNQDELRMILQETIEDFTALCTNENISALDKIAIEKLRELYESEHFKNQSLTKLTDEQFLSDIGLIDRKGRINNTAIILLGTENSLLELMPNSEIIFEYRSNPVEIRYSDRLNLRKALILSLDTIWEKINSRNFITSFVDGLFRRDIQAFSEDVIREGVLNAIVHRDYQAPVSTFIKQDNSSIEIKNPGGFISDITPQNIYKKSAWRNRRLAETLEKIGLVERSGQGADLIFEKTIKEGKGLPNYTESTSTEVVLKISALVKDKEFISYLETINKEVHIGLTTEDLILLESIKDQTAKALKFENVKKFLDAGIIVKNGVGRGIKYFLAKQYYKDHGKLGEYTKLVGLGRKKLKELILKHIEENGKGTTKEFKQALSELTPKDLDNLLQELKKEDKLKFIGTKRNGYWVLIR